MAAFRLPLSFPRWRPHCSQALCATFRQWSRRRSLRSASSFTTLNSV
jgi:hypothetical protein